jgi:excisionase family DNA binding protein
MATEHGKKQIAGRRIRTLQDHPSAYVTTSELADYWMVGRKQIYKQIEAGTLKAIRLGPRLLRISTAEALAFEVAAKMATDRSTPSASEPAHTLDDSVTPSGRHQKDDDDEMLRRQ